MKVWSPKPRQAQVPTVTEVTINESDYTVNKQQPTTPNTTAPVCTCRNPHCAQPLAVTPGEYTQWHIDTGRKQRFYVECRNPDCWLWMETFYVTDSADYEARDLAKYEKAG